MMRINLITDAPRHNLALMKISAWHKKAGDEIFLNNELIISDRAYASYLFSYSPRYYNILCEGGPGSRDINLRLDYLEALLDLKGLSKIMPDYNLFPINYSLGYTWEYCPRSCPFCINSQLKNKPSQVHYSIWTFHHPRFNKICLLNNNTFSDPDWKLTFDEIIEANLIIHDENGYDLRLLDDEKAYYLSILKFEKYIHFAWDNISDEDKIIPALNLLKKYYLERKSLIYILIGYNTTLEGDIYRVQKLHDLGFYAFPMIYNRINNPVLRKFKRMVNLRYYKKFSSVSEAWQKYDLSFRHKSFKFNRKYSEQSEYLFQENNNGK